MALNETRAKALQDIYLICRHPTALGWLQLEVESMCRPLISYQAKSTGCHFSQDRMQDIAYEASTRFVEMYLKNPEWTCKSFGKRLHFEVLYFLYDNKKGKRIHENSEDISQMQIEAEVKDEVEDTRFVIEDIMSDTVYWRNILLNCYRSRTYRSFILSIEPIVGRRWIYDHSARLYKLYKNTRRLK